MSYSEIDKALSQYATWNKATEKCRDEFVHAMGGRQYGLEPLLDAWTWFLTGWNGHS